MTTQCDVGAFDLDLMLSEAALCETNRPTQRILANACIGIEPMDAFYSARELLLALEAMHDEKEGSKHKLSLLLSNACDDFQRCLYYAVAGRGVTAMLEDLAWLTDLLKTRAQIWGDLFLNQSPIKQVDQVYIAPEPDAVLPVADPEFELGASWTVVNRP
ncbi:MAG: hypothetical protein AAGL10_09400 [Pseudomonadota bacterium]